MALKDTWVDKRNDVDFIEVEDINAIAQAVIELENSKPPYIFYENCKDINGNLLTPHFVNGILWVEENGELKMSAGQENSFLLFNNPLANNRVEATFIIKDNLYSDPNHRNGIVFALTDYQNDLTFRYDGKDVSYYWVFVNDWNCVEVVEMGKNQNWHWLSKTAVDLGARGIDVANGFTLSVEWDSNGHILVYANGVLVQNITDATPLTGNYYGLLVNKYGNLDPAYGEYDAPVLSFVAGGKPRSNDNVYSHTNDE